MTESCRQHIRIPRLHGNLCANAAAGSRWRPVDRNYRSRTGTCTPGKNRLFTQADGLSGDTVTALFEDREGNVWVATSNGLDHFRDLAGVTYSANQGFPNFGASVLAAEDGSIWVSSFEGLSRWTRGKSRFSKGMTSERRSGLLYGRLSSKGCQTSGLPFFRTMVGESGSQGLAGSATSRMAVLFQSAAPTAGSCTPWPKTRREISGSPTWIMVSCSCRGRVVRQIPWSGLGHKELGMALAADPLQGGLWLGFYQGGVAYWKDGQVRASYTTASGLGEGSVSNLRVDADGTLWAATEGGLSRLKNGQRPP